jgi:multidrug efflux pump subunit AcrB/ABC-type multidrug transport system ATPase subunit
MSIWGLPIRRPVGTAMLFLGIALVGVIAWVRIPVELLPAVSGDQLYVAFARPGSEPEVVEREILLPLEARVRELAGVEETWGEVHGSNGTYRVRFSPSADVQVRELELRRVAADLARSQPRGTFLEVQSEDTNRFSRFAMFVQVSGLASRNALLDLVRERIEPRLAAVPGVAQVVSGGASPREMTVWIDPDRCAALDVQPQDVVAMLARSVQGLRYLGSAHDESGRTAVLLDGRPAGPVSLAHLRVDPLRPVLLHHVADVELGTGKEEMLFRVDGKPTVGIVLFLDEGVNLVRLGRALRARLDELREEFRPSGIDFLVNFDAAELVEDQLADLKGLALSGFAIALVVLFLFLREWRGVAVVALAVPASLLSALALLYFAGQSINLITIFGLAVGIGMLVDNSIVVYEVVQRQLERGVDPDLAAERGVSRTVRAIVSSTVANGIVFLPIVFVDFESTVVRSLLLVLALAMLLPMAGSVLVAVTLVPLLARRLAAPAASARIAARRRRRESLSLTPPDRSRELFSGLLTVALRRPAVWLTGVVAAVLVTVVVAVPWVAVGTAGQEPAEGDAVRLSIELDGGSSLEQAAGSFERLERAAGAIQGVERVESMVREDGGALTVHLLPEAERPEDVDAERVRSVVRDAARDLDGVTVTTDAGEGGGGEALSEVLGGSPAAAVLSGPDAAQLGLLARELVSQLESMPEVERAWTDSRRGLEELRVLPDDPRLAAYGLTADQVVPALGVIRREGLEMQVGFTLPDGREIPLAVRRRPGSLRRASDDLALLRLATPAGVLPLSALADLRRVPAPETIRHHDGRRELEVHYLLGSDAPRTGPARQRLEREIRTAIQQVHRPADYTVETPGADEGFSWFRTVLIPVLLLLFAVLAVTFESLTLPLLVLVALPLTVLGAVWGLLFNGQPADTMALVGALALIGVTVNPAILLVDRMQQRAWQGRLSPGAAALAAVRERVRPVLMTSATALAGLWPLAIATGAENEIWPPFATVMMGGLATSTLLTLLVVPVGFVFLNRLDRLFGRLGPWVVIAWGLATTAVMVPLVRVGWIATMRWQLLTTALVAALLLGVLVLVFRRPERPEPRSEDGPPPLEVRYLHKIYGRPGPVGRAWRAPERFVAEARRRGLPVFQSWMAEERLLPLLVVVSGVVVLATRVNTPFWRIVYALAAAAAGVRLLQQIRRARGRVDEAGRARAGGVEGVLAAVLPWLALGTVAFELLVAPWLAGERVRLPWPVLATLALLLLVIQLGRRTALALSRGELEPRVAAGRLRWIRSAWHASSRRMFGFDLPREQVHAVRNVEFKAEHGMVGILGPNGAGKTTLLRQLAGILDPSVGRIVLGGVQLDRLRRHLARWVGYLPQEFGLPEDLTAREYLDYYALLYEIGPAPVRRERVERLLGEVGLGERADERIGGFSGGMKQRVAVARTLLRLPTLIIVDEPTVGLDPRERIRFRNLLSRLAEGRVVLFSTHVVEDVAVACERVLVMARGRIVFDGAPSALAERAAGRVWSVRLAEGEAEQRFAGRALVVDQVPDPAGGVRSRLLAAEAPDAEAAPVEPSAEDGYLWLVGAAGSAA